MITKEALLAMENHLKFSQLSKVNYEALQHILQTINLLKQVKETAKYMKTFQCDNPSSCGKGAICNSCWTRNWAIDFLKKHNEIDEEAK